MTKIDALDDATVERACRAICADYGWDADEPVRYAGTRTLSRNMDGTTIPQWRMHERDVRTALSAARLASTSPAPDGWVLVPREPTKVMMKIGSCRWIEANDGAMTRYDEEEAARCAWSAMIAAAPQPVVEKDNG